MRLRFLLLSFCLLLWQGAARAQETPEPPKPPSFPLLFPAHNGRNGYEDWVRAGDLIQNNKALDAVSEEGATLTIKRQILNDPQVQQSLFLLRQGLNKSTQMPTRDLKYQPTYPEFSAFRKLGQLLKLELLTRCADGNIEGAIDTLEAGLQFGQRMQGPVPITALSGVVVETLVLQSFAEHLDQLSDYQCSRVQHLVERWLETPSLARLPLLGQKAHLLHTLDNTRTDSESLMKYYQAALVNFNDTEENGDEAIKIYVRHHPSDLASLLARAQAKAARYYDAVLATLSLPVNRRAPIPFPKADTSEGKLLTIMDSDATQSTRWHDELEARVRLLGIHAAIRHYQWEYNRLPDNLAELHLGRLNTDPYTGKSFLYQRNDPNYDLCGFGPLSGGKSGQPVSKPEQPIRL